MSCEPEVRRRPARRYNPLSEDCPRTSSRGSNTPQSRSPPALQYSLLGNSGLVVSRIALGCMSFGSREWRPWMLEEDEARPFFRRAVELGINFFDTADVYSLGVSEEITGKWVRGSPRVTKRSSPPR